MTIASPKRWMAVLALAAWTTGTTPAAAQKSKPGGGGGTLPNVRYAISALGPTADPLTPMPSGMRNLNGMNNAGLIVGDHNLYYNDAWNLHPVVIMPDGAIYSGEDLDLVAARNGWSPAGWVPPAGFRIRSAIDVNEDGLIVGSMGDGTSTAGYVLDTRLSSNPGDWVFFALPTLGSSYSYGYKVNDDGDIAVFYRRPGGTEYDWYLYNYHTPALNEPMPLNLPGSYPLYGLNNLRQVLLSVDGRPAIFEEGKGLRIVDDMQYPSSSNPGRNLNDDGVYAWKMGGFGKGNNAYSAAIRRAIGSDAIEQLMDVESTPNELNQQADVLVASSAGDHLFHDEAGLLRIVDLIPDSDPLKQFLVDNQAWNRLMSDRSSNPDDPLHRRFPAIVGSVKTADGNYQLYRLTPYSVQP